MTGRPDEPQGQPPGVRPAGSDTAGDTALIGAGAAGPAPAAPANASTDQASRVLELETRLRAVEAELQRRTQDLEESNSVLARREAELAAVFNQTPLLQGLLGLDGTLLRANHLTFQATGFAPERQLGRKFWDTDWWRTADHRAVVRDAVLRAAAGEHVRWRSDFAVAGDGCRQGDFTLSPIRDADGAVMLVYANGRDCTEEEEIRAALAAGERRYRMLLGNLPGIVFRAQATPPWRIFYVSEGVTRLTGHPVSYFVEEGHDFQSIMFEGDCRRVAEELAAQAAAGEPLRSEYRICHRDGSLRWVEGQARQAEDDPNVFEGTVFDIDDRKRAEFALQESQAHFHYTTQNSPSVLWTARPDGRIDFISDAYIKQFGARASDLLDTGWLTLLHPDDVARVTARWRHSLETGEHYDIQFRLKDAEGVFRSFQVSGHCRRDDGGRILRWYGVLTNVDELARTQAQLRQSEELARATLQTVPGVVWRALPDGYVDFVSDACQTQLGLNAAEIIATQWAGLVHPEDLDDVSARYRQSLATGQDYESRHRFRSADGYYRWFQVHATASRDDEGRILRWYGLATNIEELLQARITAETAARAKAAFLSTMSHEIRTPLNAVLGFAGLLAESELGVQQRDFVNSIRASGDHLLGVINDILDYSKLESGGLALDYGPCDLRDLVESALDLVASQAAAKNLELVCFIADDLPSACLADGARLRQVLVNLLGNAVKFTASGEVEVRVASRPLADGEHEFEFCVRDTGRGIAAEDLTRLFRDFSQVDDSVARGFGGTGLGLAISKRLVEAHGGAIGVESRVGHGSTFRVRLPAQVCESPIAASLPSAEPLRGRRVLVVDDHRPTLESIGQQLNQWGVEALLVDQPRHAVDAARQAHQDTRPFEVAIVDQRMSDLDGLEVAKQLRSVAPIPVVLLSTLGSTLSTLHASRSLVAAVQTKPLHRAALLDTLIQVLGVRASPVAAASDTSITMPPLRLLLVEDNAVNRKLALLLLRRMGYPDVDVAVDGIEAINAMTNHEYDVVLMDVQMPNLDGLAATRRIRAQTLAWRQPEIIAMTANAMAEDREACLAAGMNAYLPKPIAPSQLTAALLNTAERRGISPPIALSPRLPSTPSSDDPAARAQAITEQVLAGGGQMGALMRSLDWAQTPLGPVYTWPQSLRTALSIVLTQKHPLFLVWGPELIQFYNDAYRPILGRDKHPAAMGQRARDCWPDIWDTIGPMLLASMDRGESTIVESGLLCPYRNGYYEEGYFTHAYSPIRDESGGVGGVLVAVSERTAQVIGARRSALLLALDEHLAVSTADRQDVARIIQLITHSPQDLPFLLLYVTDAAGTAARLACSTGLEPGHPLAPAHVHPDDGIWPVFECLRSGAPVIREDCAGLPVLPPWPEAPHRVMALPVARRGVLITGLSPRLPLDAAYIEFVSRIATRLHRVVESIR